MDYSQRKIMELRQLLTEVTIGDMSEEELKNTAIELSKGFVESDNNKKFYSLLPSAKFPSDVFADYIYTPTYIVCGIMMYAAFKYPALMEDLAFRNTLHDGLNGCKDKRFFGIGYDDFARLTDALDIFSQSKAIKFIETYPDFNSEFNIVFKSAADFLQEAVDKGKADYFYKGELLSEKAKLVLQRLRGLNDNEVMLFVYGTLMKEQSQNYRLENGKYCGKFMLKDYVIYDLGEYPGIKEKTGDRVVGEVFAIDRSLLDELDFYKREGQLYDRKIVTVTNDKETVKAYTYVYRYDTEGCKLRRTAWKTKDEDYLWYACYGSNISGERFLCYIEGGICKENGKHYDGCKDTSYWGKIDYASYKGEMYFGNVSNSWNGKGVAFFDPDTDGKTYMKLYKIKYSQLKDIRKMEGKSVSWYGRILCLGIKDDCPVYTLTSEKRRPENLPDEKYLNLIATEVKKQFCLSDEEFVHYVTELILRSAK